MPATIGMYRLFEALASATRHVVLIFKERLPDTQIPASVIDLVSCPRGEALSLRTIPFALRSEIIGACEGHTVAHQVSTSGTTTL